MTEVFMQMQLTSKSAEARIKEALNLLERIYKDGRYPKVSVLRVWSKHNPILIGEFARPEVFKSYLFTEFKKLLSRGAKVTIEPGRIRKSFSDIDFLENLDESLFDSRKKRLFMFSPERTELSINRLEHYTGTSIKHFQKHIILTNYKMYMEQFLLKFPKAKIPEGESQMPAYHARRRDNKGITIINIGVGPANAKNIIDHLAVLRPSSLIMAGHCGGLRNQQNVGDFVLASGFVRDDNVLDNQIPLNIPIVPHYILNDFLRDELNERNLAYRVGNIYTTNDRNWEFRREFYIKQFMLSRPVAIDMESATIATLGFKYRIPTTTLLCVSDKPLHNQPKLSKDARNFYKKHKAQHLDIILSVINRLNKEYPRGLPSASYRGLVDPLFAKMST